MCGLQVRADCRCMPSSLPISAGEVESSAVSAGLTAFCICHHSSLGRSSGSFSDERRGTGPLGGPSSARPAPHSLLTTCRTLFISVGTSLYSDGLTDTLSLSLAPWTHRLASLIYGVPVFCLSFPSPCYSLESQLRQLAVWPFPRH